jgi:hypothetical protein
LYNPFSKWYGMAWHGMAWHGLALYDLGDDSRGRILIHLKKIDLSKNIILQTIDNPKVAVMSDS